MDDLYINLSFDDFCPIRFYGLSDDKAVKHLFALKDVFPEIKYTFFTIPSPQFVDESRLVVLLKRQLHKMHITNRFVRFKKSNRTFVVSEDEKWCDFVIENVKKNIFEIGQHGFDHYSPFLNQATEFVGLNKEETLKRIEQGKKILSRFNVTPAFRPPGWGVNDYLEEALISSGFTYISLRSDLSDLLVNGDIFYIPQQYSIDQNDLGIDLKGKNYLFIKGHINRYSPNRICDDTIKNLTNVLKNLEGRFRLNFIFLRDIKDLYKQNKLIGVNRYEI